jgi:hypothetical protein
MEIRGSLLKLLRFSLLFICIYNICGVVSAWLGVGLDKDFISIKEV